MYTYNKYESNKEQSLVVSVNSKRNLYFNIDQKYLEEQKTWQDGHELELKRIHENKFAYKITNLFYHKTIPAIQYTPKDT